MIYDDPELIEQIIINLPNYVFWLDNQGIYQGCNKKFAALVGLSSPAKIIGLSDRELHILKNFVLPPSQTHSENENVVLHPEKIDLHLDGEIKHFIMERSFICNNQNSVIGTLVVMSDITQLGKLNASLEQEMKLQKTYLAEVNKKVTGQEYREMSFEEYMDELRDYLENIIAAMPGNVYWLNRDCVLLGGNDNLAKMFGLKSRAELVGLTYSQMSKLANWTEGQGESFRQEEIKVMETGVPRFNVEEPPIFVNGSPRYYMSNKVPIYNKENQIIGVVGISIDITDNKLAEEREKAALVAAAISKAKAEANEDLCNVTLDFAALLGHDQRSPIMAVLQVALNYERILPILLEVYEEAKKHNLTATKLLKKRDYDYIHQKHGVESLKRISTEMNALIDHALHNLKIAKRAQEGKLMPTDFRLCDMDQCLEQIHLNAAILDEEHHLVHVDKSYQFTFRGNVVLTIHIFSNLLNNALYQIRKNKRGEIFVSAEDGGDFNIVKFKDTAGGAPAEVVDKMFEGFFTTKGEEGTGVGLRFCKNMMRFYEGDIIANSVEGESMEFILKFPKVID